MLLNSLQCTGYFPKDIRLPDIYVKLIGKDYLQITDQSVNNGEQVVLQKVFFGTYSIKLVFNCLDKAQCFTESN